MKKSECNLIKKALKYDPENGFFYWRKKRVKRIQDKTWNTKHSGKKTGYVRKNGYLSLILGGKEYSAGRVAWLLHYGIWPCGEIDHINGDRIDNRILNLRLVNRSENAINKRKLQSNNTSGFKGVWKRKNLDRWCSGICKDQKRMKLGSFESPEEAYLMYLMAAHIFHGKYASQ